MDKKKERNYWPYGILAIITAVVIGGGFSIKAALEHPVQESTYYMMHYQNLEDNAYELEKQKDAFDNRFDVKYTITKFNIGKNSLGLKIYDKINKRFVDNANIDMLLTRYETNRLNKKLKPTKIKNDTYLFEDLDIQKLGRWKILTTTKIDKYRGFNSKEINATRK